MKKIKFFLQIFDGIWSVPLAFGMFVFFTNLLFLSFGEAVGSYDPAFITPLFLAAAVVIGSTNAAVLGLYFTFRGLFTYLFGSKINGTLFNQSKYDFKKLSAWQRLKISLFVFSFLFASILLVYLKLV